MFFVKLPGEEYKYHLESWPAASWIGPVDPAAILSTSSGTA
jgi:hypothetical protein